MIYSEAKKVIQKHFVDNFTALTSSVIAWDNVDFKPPANKAAWMRFMVMHSTSIIDGLSVIHRTKVGGFIAIELYVPEGEGSSLSTQIVDNICLIYDKIRGDGVVFRSAVVSEKGNDNGYFQVNLIVPFHYYKMTTYV